MFIDEENKSELRSIVTSDVFEKAYIHFIEQADRNVESKKAQGSRVPYGFSEKVECDGAFFKVQYGQGIPSATPYINWWVVSIYYIPENGNIVLGIEVDRYSKINKMKTKPLRYDRIGNKKTNIAVFYSSSKNNVNYRELYQKFIEICEEIIDLGLE